MTDRATFDTQGGDLQSEDWSWIHRYDAPDRFPEPDAPPDLGPALVAGVCLAAVVLGGVLAAAWIVAR